jgi:hypothetical protein
MSHDQVSELLLALPAAVRQEIRKWMAAYAITEQQLTVPMLRLLSAVAASEDEGVKRVIAALLEQELPAQREARA